MQKSVSQSPPLLTQTAALGAEVAEVYDAVEKAPAAVSEGRTPKGLELHAGHHHPHHIQQQGPCVSTCVD